MKLIKEIEKFMKYTAHFARKDISALASGRSALAVESIFTYELKRKEKYYKI